MSLTGEAAAVWREGWDALLIQERSRGHGAAAGALPPRQGQVGAVLSKRRHKLTTIDLLFSS